jgi:hypothetical protein
MRGWVSDCQWDDDVDADDLTDAEVVSGVQRHYDGGVAGFLGDWRADQ